MKDKRVELKDGDNLKFKYFIKIEAKEIVLEKDHFAFKVDGKTKKAKFINSGGFHSSADYIVEVRNLDGKTESFLACNSEDLVFVNN